MDSMSTAPASTLEKSRMSLMIPSSASPAVRTPCAYSRWRASRSVESSRPVSPITPFMGVRISWLIVARNDDFAREAASASSRAAASSTAVRRCSASSAQVRTSASPTSRTIPTPVATAEPTLSPARARSCRAVGTSSGSTAIARRGPSGDSARPGDTAAHASARPPSIQPRSSSASTGSVGESTSRNPTSEASQRLTPAANAQPTTARASRTHSTRSTRPTSTASSSGYAAQSVRVPQPTLSSARMPCTHSCQPTSMKTTTIVAASTAPSSRRWSRWERSSATSSAAPSST